MTSRVWIRCAVFFVAVMGAAGASADTNAEQLTRLRERVAELEKQNAALRQRIAELEQSRAALQQSNDQMTRQREDLLVERQTLEQLAGVTARGEAVESAKARFTSSYDAKANATTVRRVAEKVDAGELLFRVEHRLRVRYGHAGESMDQPPDHVLADVLTYVSPSQRYRSVESATLRIEGEAVEVPVEHYELVRTRRFGASVAGQKRYDEQLTLRLDEPALRRLGRANEATLELAGVELPLDREHLALFEAARQRIQRGM